ncbi:MAG: pyridoxal phosphate-dependent aminotransferase [Bradymonadia bacterium]
MPKPPLKVNKSGLKNAYSQYVQLAQQSGRPLSPLHVGDTYLPPAEGCRMEDLSIEDYPRLHQYSPVQGRSDLIKGIQDYRLEREGLRPEYDEIVVTAGATGGLFGLASALINPGDEVIMLAPYWPLFGNAIRHYGGTTQSLSIFDCLAQPDNLEALLTSLINQRTVAIYWNTPHNPTGMILPKSWLETFTAVARAHNLWIVADEVYEHYAFDDVHVYSRPLDPERTISAYSFSKAFGMAGNRCGYLVGPSTVIKSVMSTTRNSFYSVTTSAQIAALRALDGRGDAWAAKSAHMYQETGGKMADILEIPPPQGSTFLFLDVENALNGRPLDYLLKRCAKRGLLVAPGGSFGDFDTSIRICFTSAPPETVLTGAQILKEELEAISG